MEHHIVYRKSPDASVNPRQHQRAQLERVAVFSTYEEARLYIQMIALIDQCTSNQRQDEEYFARAIPLDFSREQLSHAVLEYSGEGWKRDCFPWNSLFHDPFRFNRLGQPKEGWHHYKSGFETRTESAFCERMCARETPEFAVGDLVFIRWSFDPDTYAVISGLGTKNGPVQRLGESDSWTGWYHVLYVSRYGTLVEEHVHRISDFEIEPVEDKLIKRFTILALLSRHFNGAPVFSEEVLSRLTQGGVRVDEFEVFPFGIFGHFEAGPSTPDPTGIDFITTPIRIPSGPFPAERMTAKGSLELCSIYVVVSIYMNYGLGWTFPEVIDLVYPPVAFSSLEDAAACAEFLRIHRLNYLTGLGETTAQAILRQRYLDSRPLDTDPGSDFLYCDRIQIMEVLMPRETITDEDLVQSMAFEDLVMHTWCYNLEGTLLWESPSAEVSNFERYVFEGRYEIGDLVYVVPQGLDPESESIEGDIAVVSEAPISKEAWLASGREREVWNPFYTVDFVDPDYYLQHYHVPESSLLRVEFPICEDLAFLPLWAKHLRGDLAFPDGLADRIRARTVLLRKCPRYDFDTGCIV